MTKRAVVTFLAGVNILLGAVLALLAVRPPEAVAQPAPLASNYVVVSGVIQKDHDALYVIDLTTRELHAFEVDRTTRRIVHRAHRDLLQDFRGDR